MNTMQEGEKTKIVDIGIQICAHLTITMGIVAFGGAGWILSSFIFPVSPDPIVYWSTGFAFLIMYAGVVIFKFVPKPDKIDDKVYGIVLGLMFMGVGFSSVMGGVFSTDISQIEILVSSALLISIGIHIALAGWPVSAKSKGENK